MARRKSRHVMVPPGGRDLLFGVTRKRLGDLALLLVALVENHAIAERERVALLHRVGALLLAGREIVQAPGIGRKQAVRPHVPVRRIAEAGWVIEDGDAERLAFDGTVVIDPSRRLAPRFVVFQALAGDDLAARLAIDP